METGDHAFVRREDPEGTHDCDSRDPRQNLPHPPRVQCRGPSLQQMMNAVRRKHGNRNREYMEELVRVANDVHLRQRVEEMVEKKIPAEGEQQTDDGKGRPENQFTPQSRLESVLKALSEHEYGHGTRQKDRHNSEVRGGKSKTRKSSFGRLIFSAATSSPPIGTLRIIIFPSKETRCHQSQRFLGRQAPLCGPIPSLFLFLVTDLHNALHLRPILTDHHIGSYKSTDESA